MALAGSVVRAHQLAAATGAGRAHRHRLHQTSSSPGRSHRSSRPCSRTRRARPDPAVRTLQHRGHPRRVARRARCASRRCVDVDHLACSDLPAAAAAALPSPLRLSPRSSRARARRPAPPPLAASRSNVQRMSALFAVDSFGGGFVPQTFIAYWFTARYGAVAERSASSSSRSASSKPRPSSSRCASRGASVCCGRWCSPTCPRTCSWRCRLRPEPDGAIALLLGRFALSQMDVPTASGLRRRCRPPDERTAAAAYTNTARYLARPVCPLIIAGAAGPGVHPGGRSVRHRRHLSRDAYDIAFWRMFRRVPLSEQAADTP